MPKLYTTAELVKTAVEDERSGVAFYSALADVVKNPEIREIMTQLADEEKVHQQRFEEMLRRLGNVKAPEQYDNEYDQYLQVLTSSRAFPTEEMALQAARDCSDDAAAVDMAARFERDTLMLMNEMRSMVQHEDKDIVEELIREEQGHLVTLAKAKALLRA